MTNLTLVERGENGLKPGAAVRVDATRALVRALLVVVGDHRGT